MTATPTPPTDPLLAEALDTFTALLAEATAAGRGAVLAVALTRFRVPARA